MPQSPDRAVEGISFPPRLSSLGVIPHCQSESAWSFTVNVQPQVLPSRKLSIYSRRNKYGFLPRQWTTSCRYLQIIIFRGKTSSFMFHLKPRMQPAITNLCLRDALLFIKEWMSLGSSCPLQRVFPRCAARSTVHRMASLVEYLLILYVTDTRSGGPWRTAPPSFCRWRRVRPPPSDPGCVGTPMIHTAMQERCIDLSRRTLQ